MLLQRNSSCLLLIDVQDKLTPLVLDSEKIIDRCQWMISLAQELDIPIITSEHYPSGLGPTLTSLKHSQSPINKIDFSCWREPRFKEHLRSFNKNQLILIGIETHVCVLQTAFDLLDEEYEVYVVVDAVSSRKEQDHHFGLKRMKQAGAQLITSEMAFFEWVEKAGTTQFKALSKAYLK